MAGEIEAVGNRSSIRKLKIAALSLVALIILLSVYVLIINDYVDDRGTEYIYSQTDVPEADAIIVLGAYVLPDGNVSGMLDDRLTVGYELYEKGKAPKIIVSGDHGQIEYDEVNSMKSFLLKKGVPSENVFMDHAGFSTYESMYRARDIFKAQKLIVVTQSYHLKRAVFDARELGIEATGVKSDRHDYGQVMYTYELREVIARNKDFLWSKIFKPEPTFLGEPIPVSGDGRATDDK